MLKLFMPSRRDFKPGFYFISTDILSLRDGPSLPTGQLTCGHIFFKYFAPTELLTCFVSMFYKYFAPLGLSRIAPEERNLCSNNFEQLIKAPAGRNIIYLKLPNPKYW